MSAKHEKMKCRKKRGLPVSWWLFLWNVVDAIVMNQVPINSEAPVNSSLLAAFAHSPSAFAASATTRMCALKKTRHLPNLGSSLSKSYRNARSSQASSTPGSQGHCPFRVSVFRAGLGRARSGGNLSDGWVPLSPMENTQRRWEKATLGLGGVPKPRKVPRWQMYSLEYYLQPLDPVGWISFSCTYSQSDFFFFFLARSAACRSSQAGDWTWATAVSQATVVTIVSP